MRPPFRYSKQEKRGISALLILIATLQCILWFYNPAFKSDKVPLLTIDSLIISSPEHPATERAVRPFNPNYINDYRGYLLGMSALELDRLYTFRKKGKYVNSAEEFRRVTEISDSLLRVIAPYLSFPQFNKKQKVTVRRKQKPFELKDLNKATAEDLQAISGIGPVLSSRIVRFRNRLGGFLVDEQLFDVYGLDEEVGRRALKVFRVQEAPPVELISLNRAGEVELCKLVYLGKRLAERIVAYRDSVGKFDSIEQLTKIEDFPSERINRIKLYLAL
ncbi:ComEA family DNA-binding protein [Muriicola marianensis]|uniref:Helix-hairpin-helix domain-containing protein n=1 Tax=Muriicola marianensis TaxID=1324801 RepID=A0ABQ1QVC7_9FLAO|nr:helix-hairpin-helix domain-containing protein [Muriicola marianensis]GGD44079.1 hypothetical protein GCM10011361_08830 [Muriicola marianensis]